MLYVTQLKSRYFRIRRESHIVFVSFRPLSLVIVIEHVPHPVKDGSSDQRILFRLELLRHRRCGVHSAEKKKERTLRET